MPISAAQPLLPTAAAVNVPACPVQFERSSLMKKKLLFPLFGHSS